MLTIGMILYNEEKQLQRVEQNIALLDSYNVKVIVADNASTDNSVCALQALACKYPIELILRQENHMGAARSQVVMRAKSQWLGFIDADCEIDESWLEHALYQIEQNPQVAAMGGPILPGGTKRLLYTLLFKGFLGNVNSAQVKVFGKDVFVKHLSTANVIYRRQDLVDVGNFDLEKSRVGEDLDMSYRLSSQGKKLQFLPGLKITHILPSSFSAWVKKVFYYGRARGQVGYDHGVLWTYPFLLPLLFFIFSIFSLVTLPIFLGVPFLIYLLITFLNALFYGGRYGGIVFIHLVSMHLAYSCGLALGLFQKLKSVRKPSHA